MRRLSVSANLRLAAMRTVRIKLCFMSVMIKIAHQAPIDVQIDLLPRYKSVEKLVASIESELKFLKQLIEVMVFGLIAALNLTK